MSIESNELITVKQAYEAMLHMLYGYWKLTDSNNITDILNGGEYTSDGKPADSAFWEYWSEAVEKVKKGHPPLMQVLYDCDTTETK
jgi:hypothetical protein